MILFTYFKAVYFAFKQLFFYFMILWLPFNRIWVRCLSNLLSKDNYLLRNIKIYINFTGILLIFMLLGLIIYFSFAYYFACLHQNNLELILAFMIMYLIIIIIFIYNSFEILKAKYLGEEIPWKFFKDRLIPSLVLFIPIISLLSLNIFNIWLHKIIFLICLHIIFVIPFLTFWNKYRGLSEISQASNTWEHSQVYIHMALAMIYPLIFVLYFTFIRYLRLGEVVDIRNLVNFVDLDLMIFAIFLLPLSLYWILVLYIILRGLRANLWGYTASICYSIHIKILKYKAYFWVMEKIFKLNYLYHDIISLSSGATTYDHKDAFWLQKVFSHIYYHPFILNIIFISSICLELILSEGKLFFGVYTLFYYPLILGIIHCFNIFGSTSFIQDVCMSDYINLRFVNPRYREKFWIYYANAEYYFGFVHNMSAEVLFNLNQIALASNAMTASKSKQVEQLFYRVWGRKYIYYGHKNNRSKKISEVVIFGQPKVWSVRVAGIYKSTYKVRWFHTSISLLAPQKPLHNLTIYFIKNDLGAILALINHPGHNIALVQQMTKNICWPPAHKIYKEISPNMQLDESKNTFFNFMETNFVMNFNSLANKGVILGVYRAMKNFRGSVDNLESMQMRPDMLSIWDQSVYKYHGFFGIDQKYKNVTNFGRNQAVIDPSEGYSEILDKFLLAAKKKIIMTVEMRQGLQDLKDSASDFDKHVEVWGEVSLLFPKTWRPPLLLPKVFMEGHLNPTIIEGIREGEVLIQKVSEELNVIIGNNETGEFPDNALEIFDGSFLQDLLK